MLCTTPLFAIPASAGMTILLVFIRCAKVSAIKLSKIRILFSEPPASESEAGWSNYPAQHSEGYLRRGFESNFVLIIL